MKKVINIETYAPTQAGLEILQAICDYGGLTSAQLSVLLNYTLRINAEGRVIADRYCTDLLKELRECGYVEEVKRQYTINLGRKAVIHKLTTKGKRTLADLSDSKVSALGCGRIGSSLEHFVLLNTFRVTLMRALHESAIPTTLLHIYDEQTLTRMHINDKVSISYPASPRWPQGKELTNVYISPDFYFHLRREDTGKHYRRFVEIDRGTETGRSNGNYDDWYTKILKYREFTKRGGLCEIRYGTNAVAVLTATISDKRLENLKRVTEEAGGKNRFWFTTFDRLNAQSFFNEPIWTIATQTGFQTFETEAMQR